MKEINIPKSANGFIYTIKSVERATIKCPKSCCYIEDKDYDCWYVSKLKQLGITFNQGQFDCIKVVINVKNIGDNSHWIVGAEDAVLIDSEGFSYSGIILCEDCLPPRTVQDKTHILPQTQVNYIQVFPLLEAKYEIAKIKINICHQWTDYILNDTIKNPFEDIEETSSENQQVRHIEDRYSYGSENRSRWLLENFTERINKLKTSIYSRLNNVLTESEKIKLENRINNELYNIKLDLQSKPDTFFDEVRETIQLVENEYKSAIKAHAEIEKTRKTMTQKVEDLLELTPREFEEYVGELFSHLGYAVEVTQYSNDKGIDIVMYKDDIKYGVQCKRYKGTVGSPDIQTFIGALSHANADKGFFVTTGMFSFEAEKMAVQHPIQLVNRIDLAKLILEALNN